MLLLSRKPGQEIVVGENGSTVVITVVEVREGQVRLGITAPRHIPVHRKELLEAIGGSSTRTPASSCD